MSAMYYMINYVTKYDVSQYQLIIAAAILKRVIKDAKAASELSEK